MTSWKKDPCWSNLQVQACLCYTFASDVVFTQTDWLSSCVGPVEDGTVTQYLQNPWATSRAVTALIPVAHWHEKEPCCPAWTIHTVIYRFSKKWDNPSQRLSAISAGVWWRGMEECWDAASGTTTKQKKKVSVKSLWEDEVRGGVWQRKKKGRDSVSEWDVWHAVEFSDLAGPGTALAPECSEGGPERKTGRIMCGKRRTVLPFFFVLTRQVNWELVFFSVSAITVLFLLELPRVVLPLAATPLWTDRRRKRRRGGEMGGQWKCKPGCVGKVSRI